MWRADDGSAGAALDMSVHDLGRRRRRDRRCDRYLAIYREPSTRAYVASQLPRVGHVLWHWVCGPDLASKTSWAAGTQPPLRNKCRTCCDI